MTDNTRINPANANDGGDVIATDDIGGVKYQRVKLIHGADGANDGDISTANPLPVEFPADSLSRDSFSRLRVSTPNYLFDAQLTYDLQPLVFEAVTAETGATVAHDTTNRCALFTLSGTPTGGKAYMVSYDHIRYQPGRSQLVFITFNFIEHKTNVLKFAGYSTGANGIEFQSNGAGFQLVQYSDTGHGDETTLQADWNIDPLDGSGPSGLTLNVAKTQILVIDMQALYVGRVRVGFDIGGVIVPVHEFNHANLDANPYIQTASLPIRCGMTCSGTASTTMNFICSSVMNEGGQEEPGYQFSAEGTVSAGSGARTHILSVQPQATFNSIVNRSKFVFESLDIVVTGSSPVKWELVLGDAITGTTTFAAVNTTYSAMEFNTAGTTSGSPAIVIAQGYVAATNQQKGVTSVTRPMRYPITLNEAGNTRILGRLTVLVTGIGGTSATRAVLNWKEIR